MNLDTDLKPFTKINSKKKYRPKCKTQNYVEKSLDDTGYGNDF